MVDALLQSRALKRFEVAPNLVGFRSPALTELGVPHAFTTRHTGGGIALELDGSDGSRASAERLHQLVGLDKPRTPARVRQVHGAALCRASDAQVQSAVLGAAPDEPRLPPPSADALFTDHAEHLLIMRVADCVPVLIASDDGRAVASIHAGWRGLIAGVIPRALLEFESSNLVAAIGPSISREHFEVGPEVVDAFRSADLSGVIHEQANGRHHIDLRSAAELQLSRAGVRRIDTTDRCTWRDHSDFFSFRRDVTRGNSESTGRMAAVIGVAPRESTPIR